MFGWESAALNERYNKDLPACGPGLLLLDVHFTRRSHLLPVRHTVEVEHWYVQFNLSFTTTKFYDHLSFVAIFWTLAG